MSSQCILVLLSLQTFFYLFTKIITHFLCHLRSMVGTKGLLFFWSHFFVTFSNNFFSTQRITLKLMTNVYINVVHKRGIIQIFLYQSYCPFFIIEQFLWPWRRRRRRGRPVKVFCLAQLFFFCFLSVERLCSTRCSCFHFPQCFQLFSRQPQLV